MASDAPQDKSQSKGGGNGDAILALRGLREAVRLTEDPQAADDILSRMSQALDEVMLEHTGMAEELLGLYEQLGMVFELARKLAGVESECEVIELFVSTLRRSFADRLIQIAWRRADRGWSLDGVTIGDDTWIAQLLSRACVRRGVIFDNPPTDTMPQGAPEIMAGPVMAGDQVVCALMLTRLPSAAPLRAIEMQLIESMNRFCGDLIRSRRLVRELREMSVAMVRSLVNAVDQKDEYTCGHSLRVAFYASALGKRLGLADVDLQMLQWAALLHDVGKIGIRDDVLKKEGKLTGAEFEHIKEHPVRSHRVVQEVPQLAAALDGILHHHERYDGSGYPAGLKGEGIPLQARIIQIADVFDALTSTRSYRPAYDYRKAMEIMRAEAGRTIDPKLEGLFEALIAEELGGGPDAWQQLVQRANAFTQDIGAKDVYEGAQGTNLRRSPEKPA